MFSKCIKCGGIFYTSKSCPKCKSKQIESIIIPPKLTQRDIFIATDIDHCIGRIREQIFNAYDINTFSRNYELVNADILEPLAIKMLLGKE